MEAITTSLFGITNAVPLEQVYKVYQVNENQKHSHIFIFNGNKQATLNLSDWFSEIEIADINLNNTKVVFSDEIIHYDDTIRTIKRKVLNAFGSATVSYPELYLYAKNTYQVDLFDIYQKVTHNDRYKFRSNMLAQLLQNLHVDPTIIEQIPDQEAYTYETLFKYLHTENQVYSINVPVGQKFSSFRDMMYPADPYDTLSSAENPFKQTVDNNIITFEKDLLLHYGPIENNNLYVCLLDDVLKYTESIGLDAEYIIRLYYPVIANRNIITKQGLDEIRQELITEDQTIRDNVTNQQYNSDIDLLYTIYNQRKSELSNVTKGITEIDMTMHPEAIVNLPLEVIFKNVHATKEVPFVKYNPGSRQENIYRLYCEKISKGGKKIPVLKKSLITSLSKFGTPREIFMFVKAAHENIATDLYLTINHNGNMRIKCAFSSSISSDILDKFLKETVNNIINKLNQFLQQTGYTISPFVNTSHHLIEINNIEYVFDIGSVINGVNFEKYINCLVTVFEINEHSAAGPLSMNYKRVDNYKKMNSMQTMITKIYQTTNSERAVIEALILNFNINEEQALMEVAKYLNDFNQINGRYVNKSFDILENQGFYALLRYFKTENRLTLAITNIDNIGYIRILDIYIDSLFRVMLMPNTTNVPMDDIHRLCANKRKTTVKEEVDLIIPHVKPLEVTERVDKVLEEDEDEEGEDDEFIFFDGEDENEEMDEEETEEIPEPDEEDMNGGAKKTAFTAEEKEQTNVFYNKMRKLEPEIILTRKEGQYNAYSRTCPANVSRQPIILTNEEKERIDKENRGAYGYALRYGYKSDKDDQHWFICPRYWCMKTNLPLTEQQVKDGKCAKEDIQEFSGRYHMKDGKYVTHNPGLVKDAHPSHGVPCCFGKNWDSEQLRTARVKYGITPEDVDAPEGTEKKIETDKKAKEEVSEHSKLYVVGFDKFPIPKERWGFLPPSVQLFLDVNYTDVITKKNAALIKPNVKTFLRYGVEQNSHQSFIGCIADIYASVNRYKERSIPTPSIKEMREILINSITLDMYLQYQNGSLVTLFQPKKQRLSKEVLTKYENTQFYTSLTSTDEAQMNFYEDTVASFERFLQYLRDDDAWIDHTYLWDIVTCINPGLFPSGLNLVLLQITDNDITDNVELICPTNSYVSNMYDIRRETVIILKQDMFYEPVYMYEIKEDANSEYGKTIRSNETFSHQLAIPELKRVLNVVQNVMGKYCKARPSMPNLYNYKSNIIASKLLYLLQNNGYIVQHQVINYRRKVIGIMVKDIAERDWSVLVPCFPSSILHNINIKYSDEVNWTTYVNTRDMLLQISSKSGNSILCKPILKVIEDEMIVGILTETNQFVQVDPPIFNVDDGIEILHTTGYANNGYVTADKELATNKLEDAVRLNTIRNIKLEGQFYSAFRTTLRLILSQHSNYEIRQKILSLINNREQYTYHTSLIKIEILVRMLLQDRVSFANYKQSVLNGLMDIADIETTYNKTQYCLVSEDDSSCKLVIPKNNLVTRKDNSIVYFKRLSDELLRYKQVRMFILEPKRYLNIGSSEYKLNESELLLLQTLLEGDYFDDLTPIQANEYIDNVTYDIAEPSMSQKYSTEVSLQQQTSSTEIDDTTRITIAECVREIKPTVVGNDTSYWKKVLPANSREIIFNNSHNCTYYVLIDIIFKHLNKYVTIQLIKTALCKRYNTYMANNETKLLRILKMQNGKRTMINRVIKNEVKLEDLIMSEEYYITNLDIWVLASYFNLPILLFSQKPLDNLGLSVQWVILGGKPMIDNYYCIRSPTNNPQLPEYHLVTPACKLNELKGFDAMINNPEYAENNLDFDTYLSVYRLNMEA